MRGKRILLTVAALVAALSLFAAGTAGAVPLKADMRYGSRGDQVRALQTSLDLLGYAVPATGYYGTVTLMRVKQFQADHGLTVDGYVGPRTREAIRQALNRAFNLRTGAYGTEDLTVGDVGPAVERLQQQLISLGYDPGPVTGVFTYQTGAALMKLQADRGLAITEIADRATFAALGAAEQPTPAPAPAPTPSRATNVITTPDGRQLTYRGALDVVATAYDATPESNGQWGPYAAWNGERLKLGDIAVDPSVIPLGTRVYVTGYSSPLLPAGGFVGQAVDTGGAIKGNRIDIYLEGTPAQVADFGIQNCKVYILEQN